MKLIIDYIITGVFLIIGKIAQNLSLTGRAKLGILIGDILRLLDKSRAKITFNNISTSLTEKTHNEVLYIMKKSYHNLGITLVEMLVLPTLDNNELHKYIKFKNIELINQVFARNKGLIFLSGHFGNWELTAYTAGYFSELPITIVVKPQSNKILDKILNKYRTMGGNRIVPMANAARTIFDAIRKKEVIALIVDQSADWEKDIFIDFFGRPAATYEAPAKLSYKFDVPILIGFAVRQPDFTYFVDIIELDRSGLDRSDNPVEELTKRHVKILEDAIRKNPELWAWQHKRWKHTPPEKLVEKN